MKNREVIYLRQLDSEYEFAVYPAELKLPCLLAELSKIGEVMSNNPDLQSTTGYVEIFRKPATTTNGEDTMNLGEEEAGMTPASVTQTAEIMEVDEIEFTSKSRAKKLDETLLFLARLLGVQPSHFFMILVDLGGWTMYTRQSREQKTGEQIGGIPL